MKDILIQRSELAKKFDLPEQDIDESLVPMLMAIETIKDGLQAELAKTNQTVAQMQKTVAGLDSGTYHQHVYQNLTPTSAWLARHGRWVAGALLGSVAMLCLTAWYLVGRPNNTASGLESRWQYDASTNTYFLPSDSYVIDRKRKGVVIKGN